MKDRVFNPYLPPGGSTSPTVGDRVYVYGSHDRFNGALKYL